jgi:tetratricopeptide (TPR) repeat protein
MEIHIPTRGDPMISRGLVLSIGALMILSSCQGSSPTAPELDVENVALERLAEAALAANDQQGIPLPSLDRLVQRTFQAIREAGGHPEGQRLLRQARLLAGQAAEARAAGKVQEANALEARSHGLTLEAILVVLGKGVAEEALAGVDGALATLDARLAGAPVPDRIQQALQRAHTLADRGRGALEQGQHRAALGAALASADVIRSLAPRYQAQKAMEVATRALRAAVEAVAGSPTDAEAASLRNARRFLAAAQDAFKAGQFQRAIRYATESARLSREVLQGRA